MVRVVVQLMPDFPLEEERPASPQVPETDPKPLGTDSAFLTAVGLRYGKPQAAPRRRVPTPVELQGMSEAEYVEHAAAFAAEGERRLMARETKGAA